MKEHIPFQLVCIREPPLQLKHFEQPHRKVAMNYSTAHKKNQQQNVKEINSRIVFRYHTSKKRKKENRPRLRCWNVKKIFYLFWIWNFINSSKKASCADNKTKMPDVGERHFFMNFHTLHLFIFFFKSHFSPSLWVTVYKQNIYSDTHIGSLRSNSIGEGGRLGDCQNRPEKTEEKTLFVTLLAFNTAPLHKWANHETYCRLLAVCPVEMSEVVVMPEILK